MRIQFYQKRRGDYPVKNFIEGLDNIKLKIKIESDLKLLETYGYQHLLQTRDAKKLRGYTNLYELITNHCKIRSRIFFSVSGDDIWLLHGFPKKTPNTPIKEIENALNNKKVLINQSKIQK